MKEVTDATFDSLVRQADKPVLVDFSAAWCGPCKMQKPVLQRFAESHPEIDIVEVDVDVSPATARACGIQAMPTLLLFQGGEVKAMARGLQSAPRIEAMLQNLEG
ncbi:MAG: thioredoxin [Polyangiaceae bacterium]